MDVRGSWRSVSVSGGLTPAHADNSLRLEIGDTTFRYWVKNTLVLHTTYTLVKHPFGADTTNYLFFKLKKGTEISYDFINHHLRLGWVTVMTDGQSVEYKRI